MNLTANKRKPALLLAAVAGLLCCGAAMAERYTVPLFVTSTESGAATGVVRILNGTEESGTVRIHAIDDAGTRTGPATFTLSASAAAEFAAADLTSGNAALGLTGGIGAIVGDARLEIETDLEVVPLAYVRAPDGTLSAMHDTVRAGTASGGIHRYLVPVFNPSTEMVHMSRLRLINPGDAAASVTIMGRDDSGVAASGGEVTLTLAAGAARTLTARQLEAGHTGIVGALGAGTGKWRLTVTSDEPLVVVNVVASTAGYRNNLSTTAAAGAAPADGASLSERIAGRSTIFDTGEGTYTLVAADGERFTETGESDGVTTTRSGGYAYARIGPDAGRLTLAYDGGPSCAAHLYFGTRLSGWFASHCTASGDEDGYWTGGHWFVEDGEGDGDDGSGEVAETTYQVNDALPGVPTSGAFAPTITGGGSVLIADSGTTISMDEGAYFELDEGRTRYTCMAAGGCTIANGTVTAGAVAGRVVGTGEVDRFPTFRAAEAPGNQSYSVGTAIGTLTLPEATGGNGTLSYSLSPAVPGLSFNASTRQITGTPSTAGTYAMTYTVTDEDGDTDTLGFTLNISTGTSTEGSLGVCEVGMTLSSGQSCTYPDTADAFSVDVRGRGSFLDRLAGIRIRIDNQTIDGRVYDFVASHRGGGVWRIDRIAGSTEVPTNGGMGTGDTDTSLSFAADAGPGNRTYTVGAAIDTLTLPEASGGNGTLTYSLAPDVPGLTFNATTRRLTGTPSTAASYEMTYTVTDEDGDSDSLTFNVTVHAPSVMLAPAGAAAFHDRFVGNRVNVDDLGISIEFMPEDRFLETVGGESHGGRFSFANSGSNAGVAVLRYDNGTWCTSSLGFESRTAGRWRYTCTDGRSGESGWRLVDSGGPALRKHHVILRVVRVTPDWVPYASASGWTQAVVTKESAHVKYFEAAIWEETSSVHLYEFNNGYDAHYGSRSNIPRTDREVIDYREQFAKMVQGDMPPAYTPERSDYLQRAFQEFAWYLVERFPDSEHHLIYNGHGGPGGRLFAAQLYYEDANEMLAFWRTALARPLGVIDMGGPCNKGSFSDLENFCRHARFYVASDLPNGGYTLDDWTIEKYRETQPETQYHGLLAESGTLDEALRGRIDLKRKAYDYSRNNMIAGKVEQANYLYSCTGFEPFEREFRSFLQTAGADYGIGDDLYRYMLDNGAEDALLDSYSRSIVHRADNRDFFEWEVVANGMLMPLD